LTLKTSLVGAHGRAPCCRDCEGVQMSYNAAEMIVLKVEQ